MLLRWPPIDRIDVGIHVNCAYYLAAIVSRSITVHHIIVGILPHLRQGLPTVTWQTMIDLITFTVRKS